MEPPEIRKLDFSEFHPLDHTLLGCRGYPGGWRRHLEYRWDFTTGPALRERTLCRLGRHRATQWWSRGKTWTGCLDCDKQLSEPQPS